MSYEVMTTRESSRKNKVAPAKCKLTCSGDRTTLTLTRKLLELIGIKPSIRNTVQISNGVGPNVGQILVNKAGKKDPNARALRSKGSDQFFEVSLPSKQLPASIRKAGTRTVPYRMTKKGLVLNLNKAQ